MPDESSWETDKIVESMINGHGPYVSGDTVAELKDAITESILEGVPEDSIAYTFLWESLKKVDWDEVYHCVIGPEPEEDDSDDFDEEYDGEDEEDEWEEPAVGDRVKVVFGDNTGYVGTLTERVGDNVTVTLPSGATLELDITDLEGI